MIEGVYTAIVTPFLADGALDEEGLKVLISKQQEANVNGIVVLGTTGEAPTLTAAEKERVIKIARSMIGGKVQCIVGTGTNATATTIAETKKAFDLGADAALVATPYYNRPTQEGLYLHYKALAESTPLPLIVYNVPGRTSVNLLPSTLKRLAEFPTITSVKEASGNISQMMEIIESILPERPDFKVLSGDDNLTLPLMSLGGHGIISVVSNLVPELIVDLYQACEKNDWQTARKFHYELLPLFRSAFIETNPIPIKAMMRFAGLPAGPCRLPLTPLSAENERKIRQIHESLKLPLLEHALH